MSTLTETVPNPNGGVLGLNTSASSSPPPPMLSKSTSNNGSSRRVRVRVRKSNSRRQSESSATFEVDAAVGLSKSSSTASTSASVTTSSHSTTATASSSTAAPTFLLTELEAPIGRQRVERHTPIHGHQHISTLDDESSLSESSSYVSDAVDRDREYARRLVDKIVNTALATIFVRSVIKAALFSKTQE